MTDGSPGEQQVGQLLESGSPFGDHVELRLVEPQLVLGLDQQPAGDALEVEVGDAVVARSLARALWHGQQSELRLLSQDSHGGLAEGGRHYRLERIGGDLPGGRAVQLTIDPDDAAETGNRVRIQGFSVGLDQVVGRRQADRVRVLDDHGRRRREVGGECVSGVEIEQVVERRPRPLQLSGVGQRSIPMGGFAVERGALGGVLAVSEVRNLLEDDRETAREHVPCGVEQICGDLRVVSRDQSERLGAQLLA